MLKLRRMLIKKFRRLTPNTELVFNDGFNVLLGRNGAGKTQLLELISAVVREDLRAYEGESFEVEWELHAADAPAVHVSVVNRAATQHVDGSQGSWSLSVQVGRPGTTYECDSTELPKVTPSPDEGGPRVGRVSPLSPQFVVMALMALRPYGTPTKPYFRTVFDLGPSPNPDAVRFDEALQCFRAILGSDQGAGAHQPRIETHVQHEDGLKAYGNWTFIPATFIPSIYHQSDGSTTDFSSDEFSFLAGLARALDAQQVSLKLKLIETEPTSYGESSTFRGYDVRVTFEDGRVATASSLSFGQKRLLAFFYYVACNENIVIADEIVNGLHWEWIETCLDAVGDRQAFLTSQNPLLLDMLPIDSQEAAASTFIQCRAHPTDKGTTWGWQNLSEHDAKELWEAYNVGVRQIGEILRARGMW